VKSERTIRKYLVNSKRDRQYDVALRGHLAATWEGPGRTYGQIARALGLGTAKGDKDYVYAIMFALIDFVATDDSTVAWFPNLRLPEEALRKKREQSKYADYNLKLYKHSPYRKIIDRDPSLTDEVVQAVIRGFLARFGAKSGLAIRKALLIKLGHLDKRIAERALKAMVVSKDIVRTKTRVANATLYSLASGPVSP
jgi:hypothetical protein